MTLPRSAGEVLSDHVVFAVECIDRMYLNMYQPQLQTELGLIGYLRGQLGCPVASTAPLAKVSDAFTMAVHRFIAAEAGAFAALGGQDVGVAIVEIPPAQVGVQVAGTCRGSMSATGYEPIPATADCQPVKVPEESVGSHVRGWVGPASDRVPALVRG